MNPGAKAVSVELTEDELKVGLLDGRTIIVPLAWYPRLLHAAPDQRANWKLAGADFGIHWPGRRLERFAQGSRAVGLYVQHTRL